MPPFMFQPMPTHPPVPNPLIIKVMDEPLIVQLALKVPSVDANVGVDVTNPHEAINKAIITNIRFAVIISGGSCGIELQSRN